MTPEDREFTSNWWSRLLTDEERLQTWLIKLEATERQGYDDNHEAAGIYVGGNLAAKKILLATADDELRHADLLVKVLTDRDPNWREGQAPAPSAYWDLMYQGIVDLESCAAVFALGEGLASDRFEVIAQHPDTPKDIKWFLDQALPDEQHHCRIFTKLAGESQLDIMRQRHVDAVNLLKGNKKV